MHARGVVKCQIARCLRIITSLDSGDDRRVTLVLIRMLALLCGPGFAELEGWFCC